MKNKWHLATSILYITGSVLFFLSASLRSDPDTKVMFSITGTAMLIAGIGFAVAYIAGKKGPNKPG